MKRRVIAWKLALAQVRELARLLSIRPLPPVWLHLRLTRWASGVAMREFAVHFAALGAVAIVLLVAFGAADSAPGIAALAIVGLLTALEVKFAVASIRGVVEVDRALEGIEAVESAEGRAMRRRQMAFPLMMLADRDVRHRRAVVYHDDGRDRLRLDVYRPAKERETPGPSPAVIQVHGGGWIVGSRLEQGIPLLNHLSKSGWVGFNIDYRLSPQASWPDHIVDVKRAIAWVRENADEIGIDPERICITGGSAGGHLTALAALTENDPAFQPGFEDADTSVSAAVPFYGIYDLTDADGVYWKTFRRWVLERIVFKVKVADEPELYRAASPRFRVHADAPPFLIIHGEHDTLVPVADARTLAAELERVSESDVRYIELPDAEHAFDLLPSIRTARTVAGIERFLRGVVAPRTGAGRAGTGHGAADRLSARS